MLRSSILAATVVACAFLSACSSSSSSSSTSSSSGSSGCTAYDPGKLDLTTPTVSFKTDVVAGVFNKSCGLSTSCHGSATASQGGLFLGAKDKLGSDASDVRKLIVGVASKDLPTMPFVTVGDPSKSFLLHKMDGDQCQFAAQCTGGDCQQTMPQGSDALPADRRDIVRRWIAQGAQDN
jgi:hypothetical protein